MKFKGIRRILVPVDFSGTANRAFDYARALGQSLEAELHIVHVLDTHFLAGAMHINIESQEEMVESWRDRSRERLNRIYRNEEDKGAAVQVHMREGRPHEEILKISDELEADIIVIGSHGRSGLEKTIFGSVAEKVLKMAEIPVLLIKLKGGPKRASLLG